MAQGRVSARDAVITQTPRAYGNHVYIYSGKFDAGAFLLDDAIPIQCQNIDRAVKYNLAWMLEETSGDDHTLQVYLNGTQIIGVISTDLRLRAGGLNWEFIAPPEALIEVKVGNATGVTKRDQFVTLVGEVIPPSPDIGYAD